MIEINSKSCHSSSFMAIHKPFWAESKAKIVSRLDHSGYYLNIEEVVHHLLVQDPQLQNLTSIYSLPAPQYLNISTSISISQYQGYHLYIFVASASTPSWSEKSVALLLSLLPEIPKSIFSFKFVVMSGLKLTGRSWQPFGEGTNGHKKFCQAEICFFATNTPFLSVITTLQIQFSIKCNIYHILVSTLPKKHCLWPKKGL